MRRAGSPVHFSSRPRMANFTPALLQELGECADHPLVPLHQRAAATDPEQDVDRAASVTAVGTGSPSAQSSREKAAAGEGDDRGLRASRSPPACVSGNSACSITRNRRVSTILGICSIKTGHASTHAAQVVHAHSASGDRAGVASMNGAERSVLVVHRRAGRGSGRAARATLPTRWAGQAAVQRPHSVQASRSKRSFQVKPASELTPSLPSVSKSIVLSRRRPAPVGRCRRSAPPSPRGPSSCTGPTPGTRTRAPCEPPHRGCACLHALGAPSRAVKRSRRESRRATRPPRIAVAAIRQPSTRKPVIRMRKWRRESPTPRARRRAASVARSSAARRPSPCRRWRRPRRGPRSTTGSTDRTSRA